uniref:Uncharacterized protein n=1 Tax=Rhizophora mucronata TaxID=61149 RepID=A0A2P2Q1Y6_RHIMU
MNYKSALKLSRSVNNILDSKHYYKSFLGRSQKIRRRKYQNSSNGSPTFYCHKRSTEDKNHPK